MTLMKLTGIAPTQVPGGDTIAGGGGGQPNTELLKEAKAYQFSTDDGVSCSLILPEEQASSLVFGDTYEVDAVTGEVTDPDAEPIAPEEPA